MNIEVKTKNNKNYKIFISNNIIDKIQDFVDVNKYSSIAILTDENLVKNGWLEKLQKSLSKEVFVIQIQSGEGNKNIKTVLNIWEQMQKAELDRKSLLINLGGGVVCDLGGFCASTYMRGIDFLQIPTTLLSQVDASVGGKTGFNLNGVKNCVGAFVHPISVIIDTDTLETLPKREYISGFSEVLKYGFIYDKNFHDYLKGLNVKELSNEELCKIIKISCEIKAKVVAEDFKEKGVRAILNYGHTLGHSIESLSHKMDIPLTHGEAVAIGMVGEAYIAKKLRRITNDELLELENLIAKYGLPIKYSVQNNNDEIYSMLFKDKKTVNKKINWVLMNKIGGVDFNIEVEENIIKKAINYYLGHKLY